MRAADPLLPALLVLVACGGAPRARYGETRLALPRTERPVHVGPPFAAYSDEAADRWLTDRVAVAIDEEIRRRDALREGRRRPAPRLQPVRVVRPRPPYYRYRRPRHGPLDYVPWSTLFYGGLGAVIGHQSGHRGEGFAIGAGIGLVQDMIRWRW